MPNRPLLSLAVLGLAACSPGEPAASAPTAGQAGDSGRRETAVFASRAQKPAAEASRRVAAARIGAARFVTPVRDAGRFWPADASHQDFARRNPVRYAGYSRFCRRDERLRAVWGDAAA